MVGSWLLRGARRFVNVLLSSEEVLRSGEERVQPGVYSSPLVDVTRKQRGDRGALLNTGPGLPGGVVRDHLLEQSLERIQRAQIEAEHAVVLEAPEESVQRRPFQITPVRPDPHAA